MSGLRLSIGLPVYNGENFVRQALDSLCTQTFENFEVIISDNGSTDGTEDICRDFSSRDRRIRYERREKNVGGAWNFNHVVGRSSGEYFKWCAHDDLCAPQFLEKCIAALDSDPSIVLAYSATKQIDEHGECIKSIPVCERLSSVRPYHRFYASLLQFPPAVQLFAVVRKKVLLRTPLLGAYSASDRTLVGELALLGRFCGIPEYLFFYRKHSQQSYKVFQTSHARQAWFDPMRAKMVTFPHWKLLREHFASIMRVPLAARERAWCWAVMLRWVIRKRRFLLYNLVLRDVV